ncbi:GNAT family N-acetyltransferase [Oceanobacillus bengalensis]|uniref:GNAT family N-acetyltransferase n=1 Tax=Oceanobacillus bengalensis TaxID=1435466 RepID=A0A494YTF0_9BACI|nr:GNAT family N-acetyltransferase [Oceanobacillus bengalensis]RKQ13369.1 GNAT family N-acetyltransferase [Oceanobacillus bengalensis]
MEIIQQWKKDDSEFIRKKLIEYNMEQLPDELKTPNEAISFVLKDVEGRIVGGITGNMYWHSLHVDFLWVDESVRNEGYGSKLLRKMEDFAQDKACRLIHLDTFSFQAPEFYKKNGYEVFGTIENHPKGFNQYFLQKRYDK